MKAAYLQCIGGASGDMLLSAMVDSGLPVDALEKELAKLHLKGFSLKVERAVRGGVTGTHLTVELEAEDEVKWNWGDFLSVVDKSALSHKVKAGATAVLQRLKEAESRAHKAASEEIQLHELGTLDTLIDVVGFVAGLEILGVEKVYSSPLPASSGVIKSEHGPLPALSPATMNLIVMVNAPLSPPPVENARTGEMVTPTGAAIVTTLAIFQQPTMTIERIGYGLGTRDPSQYPNVLALWVGEELKSETKEGLVLLETNIDDMNPQLFGYVQERLLSMGASDVWFTPVQMKKNRPAVVLNVLVSSAMEAKAVDLIMQETSTLGIRVRPVQRHIAQRELVELETSLGIIPVKIKRWRGKAVSVTPEYDACRKVALEKTIPLQEVLAIVKREAEGKLLA